MVSEGNTLQIVASGNVVEWANYFFLSGVPTVRAVSFTLTICRGHTGSSPRLGLDKSSLGTPVEQSFCSVLFCRVLSSIRFRGRNMKHRRKQRVTCITSWNWFSFSWNM
ncbi:MAG: uncharacterized protein A8A55_2579 [Amphiamblys sp. WSBS2006]|nr:MAG: uncharacterized protein A8A55_2579 [Amphiamblys sp. WSBS2006]